MISRENELSLDQHTVQANQPKQPTKRQKIEEWEWYIGRGDMAWLRM